MDSYGIPTEHVSGLDDLFYDVTLTDASTGAALTSGTVTMKLCTVGTTTALAGGTSTVTLAHQGAGRWTGTHDVADVATAIGSLSIGQAFDRVLQVTGVGQRLLARCIKVSILGV
jgi:hypothetical protein